MMMRGLVVCCRSDMDRLARIAIRRALEAAGVEFIDENGGGRRGASSQARKRTIWKMNRV